MIMLQKHLRTSDVFGIFVHEDQMDTDGIVAAYHQSKA